MGRATSHLFADEGARVAVVDRDEPGVARVVAEIEKAGGLAAGFVLDVSDTPKLTQLVEQVRERLGPVDILINNAGIVAGGAVDAADYPELWERALAVNLSAQVNLIRACLEPLARNGDGRIVNIASTEGLGASAFTSPYTASKHGVVGLTKHLAITHAAQGITINAICPGAVQTGLRANTVRILGADAPVMRGIGGDDAAVKAITPAERRGTIEEIAASAVFLASDAASYVTGHTLVVDGGWTAR